MKLLPHGGLSSQRGRQLLQFGAVLAAAVVGAALLTAGLATQQSAPEAPPASQPSGSATGTTNPSTSSPTPSQRTTTPATGQRTRHAHETASADKHPSQRAKHTPKKTSKNNTTSDTALPASKPVQLQIPRIKVDTDLTEVKRTSADQVGVPTGKHADDAGWFDESPTPGQYGASVIVGHVDSPRGPSVFYRLGALRHGNKIRVTRKDGKKTLFTVDKTRRYPDRNNLPADQVYGGNVDHSTLRLITCTDFDHKTGHYRGNTIVYAQLAHTGT